FGARGGSGRPRLKGDVASRQSLRRIFGVSRSRRGIARRKRSGRGVGGVEKSRHRRRYEHRNWLRIEWRRWRQIRLFCGRIHERRRAVRLTRGRTQPEDGLSRTRCALVKTSKKRSDYF